MAFAEQIENFLLVRRDWVTSAEICQTFDVKPRQFRQVKGTPGLCTEFAIASNGSFKHVQIASTTEWLAFKFRILWHAIAEIRRIRKLGIRRHNAIKTYQKKEWEKDTGQGVLTLNKQEEK